MQKNDKTAGEACRARAPQTIEDPYRLLVENVTDYAICMLDPNGIVSNWNRGAQRLKGYTPEEIIGEPFSRFFTEEDREDGLPMRLLTKAAKEGRYESEGWRVRKDGTRFWADVVIEAISDAAGKLLGFANITRDVSERHENEQRLHQLAHYDPLTSVPNRTTLCETLAGAIKFESPVTVLMLDLDGFKEVNDTLGHAAGDCILKTASERLQACVGERGMVGRLGGDEFAIILPKVGDPAEAARICDDLIGDFRKPFSWDHQDSYLGMSIGIAISPAHGECAEDLLSSADLALYRAKAERRNGYHLFQPGLRQEARARRHCDLELRKAVTDGELELFYQPLVRLGDYCVTGAEALLRWRHPQHGVIAPGAFLDVLQRGRLASGVGDWVIRQAAAHARKIRAHGINAFRLSVNLFGTQLRRGRLTEVVIGALEENQLPPGALEIEITESIFLEQGDSMIAPLRELRQLGVGVAFDDYGRGFASLSLLKRLPLSRLKIDRAFVRNLCTDAEDAALVRAIAYLGESFGLEITAEGVEREEQRKRLRELGCDSAQGYLFGRPMPAAEMMELFEGREYSGLARWPRGARSFVTYEGGTLVRPTALRA